jgi:hypothetical protein
VALDRETEVFGRHPGPVVDDADQAAPARLDRHVDGARAGVDGVLDQFLDGGRRPLDHLARGDAVDENGIEAADGGHGAIPLSRMGERPGGEGERGEVRECSCR